VTLSASVGIVRPVLASDLPAVERLLATDPVAHCFVSSRVRQGGLDPWRLGGELLGFFDDDGLQSAVYHGANLVPIATDARSRGAFVDRLRTFGRRCSSIVGPAEEVLDLWRQLEPSWGPAREVRSAQPLLVIQEDPGGPADEHVRLATQADLDVLVPACVAMFTAEVGVSPIARGMGPAYRARIAEIVAAGRSFVRIEDGIVVFKAEIGSSTSEVCQVQGVWVDPKHRGSGVSVPAMASVVRMARASIAPTVSLYVNDFNSAARRCYASVGFRQAGEFATVLF
jgi:predicted GNAT family acetyltransferase